MDIVEYLEGLPLVDPLTGGRTTREFAMLVRYCGLDFRQAREVLLVTDSYSARDAKFAEFVSGRKDAEEQCSNCGNLWGRIAPIDDEPSSLLYCDDCREEFLAEMGGQ